MDYVLYRYVYHCTPLELGQIPAAVVNETLAVMDADARVQRMKGRRGKPLKKK